MTPTLFLRLAAQCAAFVFSVTVASAGIVSGNNLASTALPDYAVTTNDPTSTGFAINDGSGLYSITTTIVSTQSGYDMSPYYVAGVSIVTPPTSSSDLLAAIRWGRTFGASYPSTTSSLTFANTTGATTGYFNLGMGRFDGLKAGNYRWTASNNTLYGAAGTDGNLVPNASFENADANFFLGGSGSVVTDGVHGTNAWRIDGSASSYLALPVQVGTTYTVSFWYQNAVNGSAQYEYGFSKPENGFAVGAGNTSLNINGLISWTEVTTSFTPGIGQDTWYLGGMTNNGQLQFDSVSVIAVPEPGSLALLALGLAIILSVRRCRMIRA